MPRDSSPASEGSSESFCNGDCVFPAKVSERERQRVRQWAGTPEWRFERRRGYVRPMRHLPCGSTCAVADLGECGDRKCGNYRLGSDTWSVRPQFLDFCIDHIRQALSPAVLRSGIVYCSLGSGQLLFDWELLEELTLREGARLRAVHLIDQDYGGPKKRTSAVHAQQVLAGWYEDHAPCTFRSYLSAVDFQKWSSRTGELAHILLDCDAVGARKRVDIANFRKAVLRAGGICLVLSNPAKRTAIIKRGSGGLNVLQQQVYRRGEWRYLDEVSRSRTRSWSRRRRSRSRLRRRRRRFPGDSAEPKVQLRDRCGKDSRADSRSRRRCRHPEQNDRGR